MYAHRRHSILDTILFALAMFSLTASGLAYACYLVDGRHLRATANAITTGLSSPSRCALALLHWTYHNKRFTENCEYFVFPFLRATPRQVMQRGGDCADKSRLLSALLRQVAIPATMVMCFDPDSGAPSHTVVEAALGNGQDMIMDPVYDLAFPRPDSAEYFGLLDLRRDAGILTRRLDQARLEFGRRHPVHSYNEHFASYRRASSINWNKNGILQLVGNLLFRVYGESLFRLPRPTILEEPQLFVAACGMVMGIGFGGTTLWLKRRQGARRRAPWRSPGAAGAADLLLQGGAA